MCITDVCTYEQSSPSSETSSSCMQSLLKWHPLSELMLTTYISHHLTVYHLWSQRPRLLGSWPLVSESGGYLVQSLTKLHSNSCLWAWSHSYGISDGDYFVWRTNCFIGPSIILKFSLITCLTYLIISIAASPGKGAGLGLESLKGTDNPSNLHLLKQPNFVVNALEVEYTYSIRTWVTGWLKCTVLKVWIIWWWWMCILLTGPSDSSNTFYSCFLQRQTENRLWIDPRCPVSILQMLIWAGYNGLDKEQPDCERTSSKHFCWSLNTETSLFIASVSNLLRRKHSFYIRVMHCFWSMPFVDYQLTGNKANLPWV